MIGQTFSSLTVIASSERVHKNRPRWLCRCVCGKEFDVDHYHLKSGHTKSCGCQRTKRIVALNTTHGLSKSPEHRAWILMRARCLNPNDKRFALYGGRGITICDEWNSFEAFYRDMGRRPGKRYSLDRIDVNGNYSKTNCRWATPAQQQNNKRVTRKIKHDGMEMSIAEWSRLLSIPKSTLRRWVVIEGKTIAEAMNLRSS